MWPPFQTLLVAVFSLSNVIRCAPADAQSRLYALKSTHITPARWVNLGAAPPNHVISLKIGLRQSRFDEVLRHLTAVSDPKNARYGQHLTAAEVNELIKPTQETKSLVEEWLGDRGVNKSMLRYSPAQDWISFDISVQTANRLLGCEYSVFENHDYGSSLIRTPEWSLPRYLHDHIETIQPTNSFLKPVRQTLRNLEPELVRSLENSNYAGSKLAPNSSLAAVCDTTLVSPDCLRTLYGTINYTAKAGSKNKMAMTNYLDEISSRTDTWKYLQRFRPELFSTLRTDDPLFSLVSINNGTIQQTPLDPKQIANSTGMEGNLDVQTLLGIAHPTSLTIFSTGGRQPDFKPDYFTVTNTNEPYLDWINHMLALNDTELPYVVSTSYADTEQSVSRDYAIRVCNQFAALGARGMSLLFGSGDEGVGARQCLRNDGSNRSSFIPEFPPTCPYVTIVGGTQGFDPEVAADDTLTGYTSGGGFGEYFVRPSYQDKAVKQYLAANEDFVPTLGSEYFNISGRAYPDIAAQSVSFGIVWNEQVRQIDGTSAATPAAAAVIALVNDALLAAGKPPLGFLNPWLYGGGFEAFNDVVSGSSRGCGTAGFPAQVGWDAVTGFGTPNFPKILKALGVEDKTLKV